MTDTWAGVAPPYIPLPSITVSRCVSHTVSGVLSVESVVSLRHEPLTGPPGEVESPHAIATKASNGTARFFQIRCRMAVLTLPNESRLSCGAETEDSQT